MTKGGRRDRQTAALKRRAALSRLNAHVRATAEHNREGNRLEVPP